MTSPTEIPTVLAALLLGLLSPAGHAELYKWVDGNGQVHFSDNKDAAGKAKAQTLKIQEPVVVTTTPVRSLQPTETQPAATPKPATRPTNAQKPVWNPRGSEAENDAVKCDLARRVLSGKVKHGNGATTDRYDLEVAERDVRNFCH